jgi:hypothetical protein
VFRHDDPIWGSFFPPLGYNCRCRVVPVSEARLQRKGLSVMRSAGRLSQGEIEITGGLNPRTATIARFTLGPRESVSTDPGFNSSPAQAADALLAQLTARRASFSSALAAQGQR